MQAGGKNFRLYGSVLMLALSPGSPSISNVACRKFHFSACNIKMGLETRLPSYNIWGEGGLLPYLVQKVFQKLLGHTAYIHDLTDPE